MRALILEEGYSRGALAATRALAAAGWEVGIGSPMPGGLAASSRRSKRWHRVPAAWRNKEAFIQGTLSALEEVPYDVVFGAGEAEVLTLSLHSERLPTASPFAPHDVVERALDKVTLSEAAAKVGITVPGLEPATDEAIRRCRGPVVVKARTHHVQVDGAPPRQDTNVIDPSDLARRVAEMKADGADVWLQEYIEGELIAMSVVADRSGSPVAVLQQKALEIWPPGAGASCRAVTTSIDRGLLASVTALLKELGWFGLAEIQFVVPPGGEPRLIDLNGRFYGSLSLALKAGVNLSDAWARVTLDLPVTSSEGGSSVRYQWLTADLRRARSEKKGGVVRDTLGCFAFAPTATHSIWSPSDPAPTGAYFRNEL